MIRGALYLQWHDARAASEDFYPVDRSRSKPPKKKKPALPTLGLPDSIKDDKVLYDEVLSSLEDNEVKNATLDLGIRGVQWNRYGTNWLVTLKPIFELDPQILAVTIPFWTTARSPVFYESPNGLALIEHYSKGGP
jgi:hypothetical protein